MNEGGVLYRDRGQQGVRGESTMLNLGHLLEGHGLGKVLFESRSIYLSKD